jgi:hypothetical protein
MARRARVVVFRSTEAGGTLSQAQMRNVVEALRTPAPRTLATLEDIAAAHDRARGKRGRKGQG